jgi:hypothetical protein
VEESLIHTGKKTGWAPEMASVFQKRKIAPAGYAFPPALINFVSEERLLRFAVISVGVFQ